MAKKASKKLTRKPVQKLGPHQKKWLKALESGKYKQGRDVLCNPQMKMCCLGVLFVINGYIPKRPKYDVEDSEGKFGDFEFGPKCNTTNMNEVLRRKLKFYDYYADLKSEYDQKLPKSSDGTVYYNLMALNDVAKWSFKRIAKFIRKNPEMVFKGPA